MHVLLCFQEKTTCLQLEDKIRGHTPYPFDRYDYALTMTEGRDKMAQTQYDLIFLDLTKSEMYPLDGETFVGHGHVIVIGDDMDAVHIAYRLNAFQYLEGMNDIKFKRCLEKAIASLCRKMNRCFIKTLNNELKELDVHDVVYVTQVEDHYRVVLEHNIIDGYIINEEAFFKMFDYTQPHETT